MAITRVVNPGSTSRKYAFYRDGSCLASLHIEIVDGAIQSCITEKNGVAICEQWPIETLESALPQALAWAMTSGLIANASSITKIAVRIVAPGALFTEHRVVDQVYINALAEIVYLVPVHIPIVLKELEVIRKLCPDTQCIAVSDSAFFTTMWPQAAFVSLGSETIRNYGYHGLSFASVSARLNEVFGVLPKRTIVLHVGGGVSIAALYEGKGVATSMGYTPASGVMMGTRGGDVSADAMIAYMHEHDLTPVDALLHLYQQSGFKGSVGESDLRIIIDRAASHDERAHIALVAFVQQIATKVAAQAFLMGGVDVIVLTATAMVRNPELRAKLLEPLSILGIRLDSEKNDVLIGKEGRIEAVGSIPIMVLKTDEMGEMARIAYDVH